MFTILDFQITRTAPEHFHLDVCERGQSQPLTSAEMEYRLDFMAGFELERLDYDRRNPHGRLELLRAYGTRLYEKLFASPEVRRAWRQYRERGRFLVLCLRIHDDAKGLEALPWETLFDGEEFIAGAATTEITRLPLGVQPLSAESKRARPALYFPLRLLSFASSPLDLKANQRLNVEAEQEILLNAVNDPAGQGKLMVDFEDEARREILEGSLDGGEYHILHFTGHGVSPTNGGGLLFEDAAGEGKRLSIEDFLQSLDKAKGSLRLAVISGCNTARTLYTGSFRDLARGILARGVPAVAAMQFSLSDPGGLKFAEAFYPELIAGKPLELALNAARRALWLTDDAELKPMLRADMFAPVLLTTDGECLQATAAQGGRQQRVVKPFDPAFYLSTLPQLGFGFYGRRREYRLIRDGFVQRNHRAAIVWGVGGIGKTALASHLADRLYHHRKEFSGVYAFDCRGGALSAERILLELHRYFSMQNIAHLGQIVHQSLPPEMAANFVGQMLSQIPLLVIFDNFEDLLERTADRFQIRDENLRAFITTLVKSTPTGSRFLFTTRHLFDLGDGRLGDVLALPLNDLSNPEAIYLMQRMPRLGATTSSDKAAVLERFGGHPFSLVTVDKHCQFHPLAEVLDKASRLHTELREYLGIELNCASLSDRSRELLYRLAAFRQPVPTEAAEWVMGEKVSREAEIDRILATLDRDKLPDELKQLDDAALRAEFEKVFPEQRSAPNLETEIRELIEWGLLTPVSEDGAVKLLAVHSLVREFCRDRQAGEPWRERLREAAAFYTNFTRMIPDDRKNETAVGIEMEAFELLMEAEEYTAAAGLLGRDTELLDRWGFGRDLESRYRRLLDKVSGREEAMVLHHLAIMLQRRGEYEEALGRYEQSLRIEEELGNRAGVAGSLHNIGALHQARGEYVEALGRYEQSLRIAEELGDRAGVAVSLHQLGNLHYLRGKYGEALERYEQSLRIEEELGNRAGVAGSLHQLGMLHEARGEYVEALGRYEQSLRMFEELGDRAGVAGSLHQLGNLHYLRGEYVEALGRYGQSLRIKEELGDRAGVASSHGQIGKLFTETGRYAEAFPLLLNALAAFLQLQSPYAQLAVNDLRTLRAQWDEQAFDAAWRAAGGEDLPEWLMASDDAA